MEYLPGPSTMEYLPALVRLKPHSVTEDETTTGRRIIVERCSINEGDPKKVLPYSCQTIGTV